MPASSIWTARPCEHACGRRKQREGISERFADAQVAKTIALDCALIDHYDTLLTDLEKHILACAKDHDPQSLMLLDSVPGVGSVLALILLYEIHDIGRFPRVQDFLSYCRLVKCKSESAGKTYGSQGAKIGNAHLKWAFSEAAATFLRNNPPAQKLHQRLVKQHGKGKALSIIAARLGRTVYFMLKRNKVFDKAKFFNH